MPENGDNQSQHGGWSSTARAGSTAKGGLRCALAISRLDTCNGIAEYFRRVAVYFRQRGTPVDVIVGNLITYPGTQSLLEDMGNASRGVRIGRRFKMPANVRSISPDFVRMLTRYAMKHRRSGCVVNTHSIDGLGLAAIVSRVCPKLRVVHTFQLTPSERNARFLKGKWGRFLIRSNSRVRFHAISSDITQCLVDECGMSPERVETIQYGVDTEVFRPPTPDERLRARTKFGVGDNVLAIVVVARLTPIKGHDVLIQALARIPAAAKKFMVLCVGAGDPEPVAASARSCGLDGAIRFLGHQHPLEALWAADIFVLSSEWEGFPIVGVEAMACGLPLVRTAAGGAREQIEEGVNGFVVPIGDATTLADRLARLVTNEELLDDMRRMSRERAVKRFQLDAQLEKTRQFFQSLQDAPEGF